MSRCGFAAACGPVRVYLCALACMACFYCAASPLQCPDAIADLTSLDASPSLAAFDLASTSQCPMTSMESVVVEAPEASGAPARSSSDTELLVVSYNVQMLNRFFTRSNNFRTRFPEFLRFIAKLDRIIKPDVIMFQELFSSAALRAVRSLKNGHGFEANMDGGDLPIYPFQTPVVGQHRLTKTHNPLAEILKRLHHKQQDTEAQVDGVALPPSAETEQMISELDQDLWDSVQGPNPKYRPENGGAMIISKHPIVSQHSLVYSRYWVPDNFSSKGAVLAQVLKDGKLFNVVTTHMQSRDDFNELRLSQVLEMRRWLEGGTAYSLGRIPAAPPAAEPRHAFDVTLPGYTLCPTDPLIIGGDFNFRYDEDYEHVSKAFSASFLNAELQLDKTGEPTPSYDTVENDTCRNGRNRRRNAVTHRESTALVIPKSKGRRASSFSSTRSPTTRLLVSFPFPWR
eukprot:GHVT01085871.1.p1 GENE.GHVT01085871.1~~GHVT01085871.1.p1  ORF type:complete len:456 (-),score=61.79 GHVT01085871.1:669-2036(-)